MTVPPLAPTSASAGMFCLNGASPGLDVIPKSKLTASPERLEEPSREPCALFKHGYALSH